MIVRCPSQRILHILVVLILAAAVVTAAACGSSATTATGPSPVKCQVALSPSSNAFGPTGGAGQISVSAQPECAWTASTEVNWIGELSPRSGQGSAQVTFQVPANAVAAARQGNVVVNSVTASVHQDGAPCQFDISPRSHEVGSAGGVGSIVVSATGGCSWSASSAAEWIAVSSGSSGIGSGTIGFQVAPNPGPARTGSLTIAGQLVTVTQGSGTSPVPGCTYSVVPPPQTLSAAGGSRQIAVTAATGCTWTAQSDVPWIAITAGNTGSGSGTVTLLVLPNTGSARAATLTIAGHAFAITQAAVDACSYSISRTSQSIASAGGAASPVAITTTAGCAWTATSAASWIAITSAASGSGNGTVIFTIAANTGAERKGTLLIAGHTFTVTQAAAPAAPAPPPPAPPPPAPVPPAPTPPACVYTLTPTSQTIAGAGGAGTPVAVSSPSGCTWTAGSNAPWIVITSNENGVGSGVVTFTASTNTGGQRIGTLTIAGQTVTVTQTADACAYSIAPTSQAMPVAGGQGAPIAVTTADHCAWTAASNDAWLTITSGATGTGNGAVAFTAAANSTGQRTGTLTIAGATFTVTQAAVPCAYAINPTNQSVEAAAVTGATVTVTTNAGCAWTATSNDGWLFVTSGAIGSGNGSVTFAAAANTGAQRTGTLTIAGQTFTVTQAAAACQYTINPMSQSVGASGGGGASVAVTTSAGCAWTATSNHEWITITSAASGSGTGSVGFTVAANTGSERTGTLTIASQTFTVTQAAAPCTYAIKPPNTNVGALGSLGIDVAVATSSHCAWTAASNEAWIIVLSGTTGSGNGTVRFSVAPNAGSDRKGTLVIAGQIFTVRQDGVLKDPAAVHALWNLAR